MINKNFNLMDLANPKEFHGPLDCSGVSHDELKGYLEAMLLIRLVETRLALGRRDGDIGGPVHLGVGQEAVAVGVSKHLRNSDRIFGAHRSHSHLLALNPDPRKLFSEVLGREGGFSRGMGGSMHLWDQPSGFYGSVPIVAGTVPLAVGAGIAARLQGNGDLAIAYLGDGAIEEGVVHESLNLARMLSTPVIFVVENNLFASHMHISKRQPLPSTARFAEANDIPYRIIDGNDVIAVAKATAELADLCRAGSGPGFIEAVTYRWYGHVDWRDDIDVGVHRSQEDVQDWKSRDPIKRLRASMINLEAWSEGDDIEMENSLRKRINLAWSEALNDPFPNEDSLLSRVYAS